MYRHRKGSGEQGTQTKETTNATITVSILALSIFVEERTACNTGEQTSNFDGYR